MVLDVNVLVTAHRQDAVDHEAILRRVMDILTSDAPFGISELVLSGFIRIVTHPRIYDPPSDIAVAMGFANLVREQPNCMILTPGQRHWDIFTRLCLESDLRGNDVADAFHAALAIENGAELLSADLGFKRFRGLKWRHPLGGEANFGRRRVPGAR